jgi:hypothetical protein
MCRIQSPIFFYLIWIFSTHSAFPQQNVYSLPKPLSISSSIHFGFNNSSNPKLAYIIDSRPVFAELDISYNTNGQKLWQQINGYPEIGLGLLYGNSGSREYIGKMGAILAFMKPAFYKSHAVNLTGEFGIGPGWIQKPFNAQTNYKNLVIGSSLNVCIKLQAGAEIKILPKTQLEIGFSFTHFSNGSMKLPNLGLNIPAISAGLKYSFIKPEILPKRFLPPLEKKWNYYLFILAAYKQAKPLESPLCWINLMSFEMLKEFSHTGRFGGGFNLTYDRALREEIPFSTTFAYDQSKLKLEASLYGSYEYVMGNFSIPFQLGVYLYNNYPVTALYENIGIRYRFSPHWIAGAALKAHFANGDFIQWGLGYKF